MSIKNLQATLVKSKRFNIINIGATKLNPICVSYEIKCLYQIR